MQLKVGVPLGGVPGRNEDVLLCFFDIVFSVTRLGSVTRLRRVSGGDPFDILFNLFL